MPQEAVIRLLAVSSPAAISIHWSFILVKGFKDNDSMGISCRFIMIHLLLDDGISSVNVNGLPSNVGSGIRTEVDGHAGKILVRISKTFLGNMA